MHDSRAVTLRVSGVDEEFSFIHWTDIHLSECDQRNQALMRKMAQRADAFGGDPTSVAQEMVQAFNALSPDLVAVTGDFLDAPTELNIELGREILDSIDASVCMALGNHEWRFLVKPMDRDHWRPRMRSLTENPLDWHVRQVHGVNLLFVDDSNYQVTAGQLRKTRQLLEDGRSCILFMHVPIAIDSLIPRTVQTWKTPILLGAEGIPPERREQWQMGKETTPDTTEFCGLVKSHPNVKAIFAGHLHFDHDDEYRPGCRQYVTGGGFQKMYRRVRVVPERTVEGGCGPAHAGRKLRSARNGPHRTRRINRREPQHQS